MSASLRRTLLAVVSAVVLLGVSACGNDTTGAGAETASRLDAVTISGDVGTAPEVTWKSRMSASTLKTETITEGDGVKVTDGQSVLAQLWVGNGYSEDQSYSSYDQGSAQLITAGPDSIPAVAAALSDATVGSRVAVTGSAADVFGSDTGNPSLGIGNQDSVLVILDLVSSVLEAPDGAEQPAPEWMPALTRTDDTITGFDFTGIPAPTGKFRKATLFEGEGERISKGMTVVVRYLGQVYGGAAPFDENYSKAPSTFQIGVGQVIPGWDKNVVGSNIGSRIVIEVPPKLGYGAAGNSDAGIAGTDTLYFAIDILAAA